jgi:hypothetical protein
MSDKPSNRSRLRVEIRMTKVRTTNQIQMTNAVPSSLCFTADSISNALVRPFEGDIAAEGCAAAFAA